MIQFNCTKLQFTDIGKACVPAFLMVLIVSVLTLPLNAQSIQMRPGAQMFSHQDSVSRNTNLSLRASVSTTDIVNMLNANRSVNSGFYSYYLLRPTIPVVEASQGDFSDRIEVKWSFDGASAPPDEDHFKVYRNGSLLATLPKTQYQYIDYNVYPGQYYNYEVTGNNEFGESERGATIGFVNPNGTITGAITTMLGRPVNDVEVSVSPTLGKALLFDGFDDYVAAGNQLRLDNKSFTIEFWMKRSANDTGTIFHQNLTSWAGNSANKMYIGVKSPGNVIYGFAGVPFQANITEDNQWHHYAWVQDNVLKRGFLYRDGNLLTSYNLGTVVYTGTGAVEFGRAMSSYLQMFLDEMRVWGLALDTTAIKRNMRRTVNTNADNLLAYWKFDEGIGALAFDLSPATNNGQIYGATFDNDRSPIRTSAFTDTQGNYIIEGINYGSSTNFSVIPSRSGRIFSPPSRIVTLSSSNSAVNNIDFTDISQVPVSGFVTHQGNNCPVDSIEILVNGKSYNPRIFTNAQGKYTVEFEPGSTQTLAPSKAGYIFNPAFRTLENIVDPISNAHFSQTRTYSFSGKVAGGNCDLPIGRSKIILRSVPTCVTIEFFTDNAGNFSRSNLAPLEYSVEIIPDNPSITLNGDRVSLKDTSQSRTYRYYAPISVRIEGMPVEESCNLKIVPQFIRVPLTYRVFERYSDGTNFYDCPVDTATLTIKDAISDKFNSPRTVTLVNGEFADTIITGYPNIVAPYKKIIEVAAAHSDGRSAVTTDTAIVTGMKPRSTAFTTTSPGIPILILRDPPGDASYSYLSNAYSATNSMSMYAQSTSGGTNDVRVSLAPDFSFEQGFMFSVSTEIDLTYDITSSMEYTQTGKSTTELATSISTSENFSTADAPDIIGSGGDVFIGGAMNLVYGVTDNIEYNDSCGFREFRSLVVSPKGFATTFIYTSDYIQNFIIPSLELLNDTAGVNSWQRILDFNDSLKEKASFSRNISFSAGANAEYIETTERTRTEIFEFDMTVDQSIGLEIGATINGVGAVGGFTFKTGFSFGESRTSTTTFSNTVGFSLRDDDPGDAFSVNVYKDRIYGTPVFKTVTGQSSCPWEENTVARDSMGLTADNSIAVNVHPDSMAVFNLQLQNLSQLNETREYQLRVLNETNQDGAIIAINGIVLAGGLNFTIQPYSQVNAVMTVKRGPTAYNYENIGVVFTSPCEWEAGAGGELSIADTLFFTVRYLEPCSQVALAEPGQNWKVNGHTDSIAVKLFNYNKGSDRLDRIEVQYRSVTPLSGMAKAASLRDDEINNLFVSVPMGRDRNLALRYREVIDYSQESRTHLLRDIPAYRHLFNTEGDNPSSWFVIKSIPRNELNNDFTQFYWKPSLLTDGYYELRAVAFCGAGGIEGVSPVLNGFVDKTPPVVLGTPQPADGVLQPNDEISITFNEPIDCASLSVFDNFALINTQTGQPVDYNYSCNGQKIVFVPAVQNRFIENRILKMVVKKVKDVAGNIMQVPVGSAFRDSTAWEFLVDRNPISWTGGEITAVKYVDESVTVTRTLQNTGSTPFSYTLTNLPNWLSVSPASAIVQPQGALTITFTFNQTVASGQFTDTVYASTQEGDEPIILNIRVLCRPPLWTVRPSQFQYSMNIIGQLFVDTVISTDQYDKIAAFVGDSIRGVAEMQYVNSLGAYRLFLTVYGNSTSGETMTFRVWDASSCTQYGQIIETYTFVPNEVLGTIENPVSFSATPQIIQSYPLEAGWSWLSFNTRTHNMSLNSVLAGYPARDGDIVKNQTLFSQYVTGIGWIGTLDTVSTKEMYLMRVASGDTLRRIGYATDPNKDTIGITTGWNWLGFTPQGEMGINYALSSFAATNGDLIKSQTAFAVYSAGNGWIGNLLFMKPRLGYLLKAAQPGYLLYPRTAPTNAPMMEAPSIREVPELPGWRIAYEKYQFNMPVIAKLDGISPDSLSDDDVLGIFVGEQCRGLALPVNNPVTKEKTFFAMAYSNFESGEVVTFKLFRKATNTVLSIGSSLLFNSTIISGTPDEPMILPVSVTSAEDEIGLPKEFSLGQNYPNPFNPVTTISYALPKESEVKIEVYTIMGEMVRTLVNTNMPAGYHKVSWDARDNSGKQVTSGIYFYKMKAGDFGFTRKLVLLK